MDISNLAGRPAKSSALENSYAPAIFLVMVGVAMAVFVVLNLLAVNEPALYMDAINPDYEAVRVLDPTAPVTMWVIPGNLLFDRFPVLLSLYCGTYSLYWGLPFFFLMGGSILSVRVAHLCIGLMILSLVALISRQGSRRPALAGVVVLLLALDPAFAFVFRTQAYIGIFPSIFLLSAMLLMYRKPTPRGYLIAGVLAGLAPFGYFIYFFAWPGLVIFALRDRAVVERSKSVALFIAGLCLGLAPYFLGYGLLFHALGLQGGVTWLQSVLVALHVNSTEADYGSRIASVLKQIWLVCTNQWEWRTFWASSSLDLGQAVKVVLLILLPLSAAFISARYRSPNRSFLLVALPAVSFIVFATPFGDRLGGHEFNLLVPLSYALAAISASALLERFPARRNLWALLIVGLAVGVVNLNATAVLAAKLGSRGAAGLYSSIISDYPQMELARHDATPHIFWSWGAMMPFIYETHGSIPAFDHTDMKGVTCRYGRAKVIALGDDVDSTDISAAFQQSGLRQVGQETLTDRHSGFPYEIISVIPAAGACADGTVISGVVPRTRSSIAPQARSRIAPQARSSIAPQTGSNVVPQTEARAAYDFTHGMVTGLPAGVFPESSPDLCCFTGAEAVFPLRVPAGSKAVTITLYQPQYRSGTVVFDFEGVGPATTVGLKAGELRLISVDLPKNSAAGSTVKLRLRDLTTLVPSEAGINGDVRRLGVVMRKITFSSGPQ